MNQACLICCSRGTLNSRNMVGAIDLIFSNGCGPIVGFNFSSNILLITSLILHVLLNPYVIQTYHSISSKFSWVKGILPNELDTLKNLVSFNAKFMGYIFKDEYKPIHASGSPIFWLSFIIEKYYWVLL